MEQQSLDEIKQALTQQETETPAATREHAPATVQQPVLEPSPTSKEAESSLTDTVRELAESLGEASGQIVVHRDLSTLLDRMKDGVVVQLSVSRPRFFKKLSLEDLGLKINQELATSEEALRVLTEYFQFGRRSLLPRQWQDRLANAENNARYCLKRHS